MESSENSSEVDEQFSVEISVPNHVERNLVITVNPGLMHYDYSPHVGVLGAPVEGEAFCNCLHLNNSKIHVICNCGEEDSEFEWTWDENTKSAAAVLMCDDREVKFHSEYSSGTAAVRGTKPMTGSQYYWEVKMTTPVYGTDMMVGVGTGETNLNKFRYTFGSLLGDDNESWGFSYSGNTQHKGVMRCYSAHFGHGSIIGVHLDMWNGTLSFYKNRQPLGIAYTGLQGKTLFPMVSSTAARSGMKVIRSRSFKSCLQFLCCVKLRQCIPSDTCVLDVLQIPPGLKTFLMNNLDWLLCARKPPSVSNKNPTCSYSKRKYCEVDSSNVEPEPAIKRQRVT